MLNELFDNIYCLNLPSRPDRLDAFKEQAIKLNFHFQTWTATDANDLVLPDGFNMEVNRQRMFELACKISHIRILRNARENHYKRILILEDDAVFRHDIERYVIDIRSLFDVDMWHMLYFGYSFYGMRESKIPFCSTIVKTHGCLTTHAYAVNCRYIPEIFIALDYRAPIDVLYRDFIHTQNQTYLLSPLLVTQAQGYSDILGRDVNYEKLIK